jgi:signal transduction histidine kinase
MRLGLLARIILIVAVAFFAIQLVALAFYFGAGEGRRALGDGPPSLPRQIASLALLVDEVPADLRPALVEAFSENGRTATVIPALPDHLDPKKGIGRIERAIRTALALRGAQGRLVLVRLDGPSEDGRGDMLSVYVGLADGGYLWLDIQDRVTVRLLGVPIGFFAGLFGVLVALAALVAVAREMRPITRLAREVDRVGENIAPVAIPERGAPELRTLIRAVNAMQERIGALVRNRALTLGAISHDLRTYLTRLRLRVEMMPESRHRAGAIADVEAMQALVEDALDFAQDSFTPTEPGGADLAAALRRYVDEQSDARIVLDVPDGPVPVVMGDKALGRVIANVVGNALRYGERAFIRTEAEDARTVLVIEDEGPGIPAEERERVFEPFHRLECSRNRDSGGTGLGLTIVRRLVERHGGSVELDTNPRGGLAVRVRLPRAEPAG